MPSRRNAGARAKTRNAFMRQSCALIPPMRPPTATSPSLLPSRAISQAPNGSFGARSSCGRTTRRATTISARFCSNRADYRRPSPHIATRSSLAEPRRGILALGNASGSRATSRSYGMLSVGHRGESRLRGSPQQCRRVASHSGLARPGGIGVPEAVDAEADQRRSSIQSRRCLHQQQNWMGPSGISAGHFARSRHCRRPQQPREVSKDQGLPTRRSRLRKGHQAESGLRRGVSDPRNRPATIGETGKALAA